MVEEMYNEEFRDFEMNCNLSSENAVKGKRDGVQESDSNLVIVDSVQVQPQAELDRGVNAENMVMNSGTGKLQGDQNQRLGMNNVNNSSNNNLHSISTNPNGGDGSLIGSTHATYDLSELGNFTVGGHVSLALELRNCESDGFSMSDDAIHKRGNQTLASSTEADLLDYHFTDSGKQQHRFGNPHLLHEFVV